MTIAELVETLEQEDHALTAWVLAHAVDSTLCDAELSIDDARFVVQDGVGVLSLGWEQSANELRTVWLQYRREVRVPLDADGRPRWTIEARQLIRAVQKSRREYRK